MGFNGKRATGAHRLGIEPKTPRPPGWDAYALSHQPIRGSGAHPGRPVCYHFQLDGSRRMSSIIKRRRRIILRLRFIMLFQPLSAFARSWRTNRSASAQLKCVGALERWAAKSKSSRPRSPVSPLSRRSYRTTMSVSLPPAESECFITLAPSAFTTVTALITDGEHRPGPLRRP